jgi:hypothetical protein
MRKYFALALSTLLLIVLPASGLIGGGYLAWEWGKPDGMDCGLFVFPLLMVTGIGALLGLAVGIGIGWVIVLGVIRWANRCGFGEVPYEPPPM